ncbi:Cyclic nucleotide-gated ion channel like [Melia azedarach]|uniref:Cyclic nucleotide-gated ion channel like n=1 Tax=Melia azedarach TaxID=155640 RepID=A0ACC1X8D5_MELAZ|nr:Cyclic nucleotide-gated ion channel like [Melia azedarach]
MFSPSLLHFFSLRFPGLAQSQNDDSQLLSPAECYTCSTQVGIPFFHSTSCDGAHQPEWQASAGSSLMPIQARTGSRGNSPNRVNHLGLFGPVLDPRSGSVLNWNRVLLLARGIALAVDPMFFYCFSLYVGRGGAPCVYLDAELALVVTVLRTCVDAVHLCHLWLQFRLAYVSRESLVVGCGKLVWDARAIACHYVRSLTGFWLDVFVILPIPQAVLWLVVPKLIRENKIKLIMTILLLIILFQFLPKVYHSLCLMRRMRKVTGYIFGSIWWGFSINLIAYLIFSHVAGGCWYALATQRVVSCLQQQCESSQHCNLSLSCSKVFRKSPLPMMVGKSSCLDNYGPFKYGIYATALPVISSNSTADTILYPIFWGLLNLSSFGNELEPTSNLLEVMFSICIVLCGLTLFTLLIGNIQVTLQVVMARKKKIQLRSRDVEWWMKRRQLPSGLRRRVRHFERQRWATMGEDEQHWIDDLPEGLRRDIKRYLCLDLIKKVPLFHNLDDLILDNTCDRIKPLIYSKDEKIIREGDPVARMVFIVRGRIKRSQSLSKGKLATSVHEAGGFLGDELLSWCLRRPFKDRLPVSSATFTCTESVEAYGLNANDLRYITEHFRYKFADERLKRIARYYSSNWRTWAAVKIQLAWRCYRMKSSSMIPVTGNGIEGRLFKYAAIFMSVRPHDHLE